MIYRLLTICFLILVFQSTCLSQTLIKYVWAESGLIIRDKPSTKGKIIGKFDYGDTVSVLNNGYSKDHYTLTVHESEDWGSYKPTPKVQLKGVFVEVAVGDSSAYVFNGFLSRYPALLISQNVDKINRERIVDYFERVFGILSNNGKPNDPSLPEGRSQKTIYGNGFIFKFRSYYEEYGFEETSEFLIDDFNMNELYLLIQSSFGLENLVKTSEFYRYLQYENNSIQILRGEGCFIRAKYFDGYWVLKLECGH